MLDTSYKFSWDFCVVCTLAPKEEKIRLLEDIVLDLRNEMEAQDQNMHPEIHNKLAEGLRLATNFIRELHDQN